MNILPEDTIREIFLLKPSEYSYLLLQDKKLALDLLEKESRTAQDVHFLFMKGRVSRLRAILVAIIEDDDALIKRLLDLSLFNNKEKQRIAEIAVEYNNFDVLITITESTRVDYLLLGKIAIANGSLEMLLYLIDYSMCEDVFNFEEIAENAAVHGQIEILMTMLSGYPNKDGVLVEVDNFDEIAAVAAENGHKDIVIAMIKLGAYNYDVIAENAARGGHNDIVYAMISGFPNEDGVIVGANNWDSIAREALHSHNTVLAYDMLKRYEEVGISESSWAYYIELSAACCDSKLFNYMLEVAERNSVKLNYRDIAENAARYGNYSVVESFIDKIGSVGWNFIAINAATNGDMNKVMEMITKGADCLETIAESAAQGCHRKIVNKMIEMGVKSYFTIAFRATIGGCRDIVLDMLNGDKDGNIMGMDKMSYNRIAAVAAKKGYRDILTDMVKLGANNFEHRLGLLRLEDKEDIMIFVRSLR